MKKIFISFAMMFMAMGGYAATEDDGTYVGWPANYGGVMLQGFWWDSYEATQWTELTSRADELSQYFDLIWVPNSGMTSNYYWDNTSTSMGYDPCFWLDHNSCFGTEAQLRTMISTYKAKNVGIIEDVVINHKNGVSEWRDFPQETKTGANTNKVYELTWDNTNYSGICKNDECSYYGYTATGNYDTGDNFDGYRDLDHTNTTVQNNIITYLDFLKNELGYAGFRYDMVKGYAPGYIKQYNTAENVQPMFSVGEYWDDQTPIQNWISNTAYSSAAFDFPLKFKLNTAVSGGDYSALEYKSFTYDSNYSQYSVTFADNHDTGRNSDKLTYNWSAANAFILASPGTPCVWLPHYNADPTNIGAMILARKRAGITNTGCTVLQQYATSDNGGYVLETQGSNGKVYVQFGNAVGYTPDGYTLVASGDSYKFYAVYDKPAVIISPNGGTFYTATQDVTLTLNNTATSAWYKINDGSQVDFTTAQTVTLGENIAYGSTITLTWGASDGTNTETGTVTFQKTQAETQSVYLNNVAQWSSVYCYAWNEGGELLGSWPGTQVTTTTTPDGYYQQDFLGEYPTYVIWNTGLGGEQTADLTYAAGTTYTNGASSETNTVYLNNTANWTNVYCYAWNGDDQMLGHWPGTAITTKDSNGNYVANISGTPTNIIWNNGSGTQTEDLTFTNGLVYTNGSVAEIGDVKFGYTDNWTPTAMTSQGDYTWTYSLDLSGTMDNVEFKLVVGNTWLGYNQVTIDAPNGWIPQVADGNNFTLKNASTHYKTYLITAIWTPNASATSGWTVKVEGVDARPTTIYTVAGYLSLLETDWDINNTNNDMSLSADGTYYELTKLVYLAAGYYQFKVAVDRNWSNAYPSENYSYNLGSEGLYEVTFYFHPFTDNSVTVNFVSKSSLDVVDGISFIASKTFTASTATYSRDCTYEWGTLCLPFAINNVTAYNSITFYNLKSVDDTKGVMYFEPISSGNIAAGNPVIFKLAEPGTMNILEKNTSVATAPTTKTSGGFTLNGTFYRQKNLTGIYIARNKFWRNETFNVSAYRGWFTSSSASQASYRISVEDGTDDIQYVEQEDGSVKVYYDLQGRKTNADRKGLVIENGKVIFIK